MSKKCPYRKKVYPNHKPSCYAATRTEVDFDECYGQDCMAYKHGECLLMRNKDTEREGQNE